jgi:hypothetical protein
MCWIKADASSQENFLVQLLHTKSFNRDSKLGTRLIEARTSTNRKRLFESTGTPSERSLEA